MGNQQCAWIDRAEGERQNRIQLQSILSHISGLDAVERL